MFILLMIPLATKYMAIVHYTHFVRILTRAKYTCYSAPMTYDNFTQCWQKLKLAMSSPLPQDDVWLHRPHDNFHTADRGSSPLRVHVSMLTLNGYVWSM